MGDFTTAGEVESVTAHEVINTIIPSAVCAARAFDGRFGAAFNRINQ